MGKRTYEDQKYEGIYTGVVLDGPLRRRVITHTKKIYVLPKEDGTLVRYSWVRLRSEACVWLNVDGDFYVTSATFLESRIVKMILDDYSFLEKKDRVLRLAFFIINEWLNSDEDSIKFEELDTLMTHYGVATEKEDGTLSIPSWVLEFSKNTRDVYESKTEGESDAI